jgi:hypothetical protein
VPANFKRSKEARQSSWDDAKPVSSEVGGRAAGIKSHATLTFLPLSLASSREIFLIRDWWGALRDLCVLAVRDGLGNSPYRLDPFGIWNRLLKLPCARFAGQRFGLVLR